MKKFCFGEAKLLALRKQQVTIAELSVSTARQQELAARRSVQIERKAIQDLSGWILNGGSNNLTHASHTALVMRQRLEASDQRLAAAQENLAAKLETLRQTQVAANSLAELEAVRRREYTKYQEQQVQIECDFHSSRKWMMKGRLSDV